MSEGDQTYKDFRNFTVGVLILVLSIVFAIGFSCGAKFG